MTFSESAAVERALAAPDAELKLDDRVLKVEVAHERRHADIFKLHLDCLLHVMSYLELCDIISCEKGEDEDEDSGRRQGRQLSVMVASSSTL